MRKITGSIDISSFHALAFDKPGNLYVANTSNSWVTVYAPGKPSVLRKINAGMDLPFALALDRLGNLYVANNHSPGSITVYAPGKTSVLRTISSGIGAPVTLALDSSNNLYVANNTAATAGGSVTVYAPGKTSVLYTIPTQEAMALALGSR
jgi:DNA-binding beta-propeller fold protein YncE